MEDFAPAPGATCTAGTSADDSSGFGCCVAVTSSAATDRLAVSTAWASHFAASSTPCTLYSFSFLVQRGLVLGSSLRGMMDCLSRFSSLLAPPSDSAGVPVGLGFNSTSLPRLSERALCVVVEVSLRADFGAPRRLVLLPSPFVAGRLLGIFLVVSPRPPFFLRGSLTCVDRDR